MSEGDVAAWTDAILSRQGAVVKDLPAAATKPLHD